MQTPILADGMSTEEMQLPNGSGLENARQLLTRLRRTAILMCRIVHGFGGGSLVTILPQVSLIAMPQVV